MKLSNYKRQVKVHTSKSRPLFSIPPMAMPITITHTLIHTHAEIYFKRYAMREGVEEWRVKDKTAALLPPQMHKK